MITPYDCLLCNMEWDLDRIVDHYEYGGYVVWEFHPADGVIWLELAKAKARPVSIVEGVFG